MNLLRRLLWRLGQRIYHSRWGAWLQPFVRRHRAFIRAVLAPRGAPAADSAGQVMPQSVLGGLDQVLLSYVKSAYYQSIQAAQWDLEPDAADAPAGAEPLSGEGLRRILNRELSPQGALAAQGLWTDDGVRVSFGADFAAVLESVTARVIEVPFVLRNVPPDALHILDLAPERSLVPLQLASGTTARVTVAGAEAYPFPHARIEPAPTDTGGALRLPDGVFDCVVRLSPAAGDEGLDWIEQARKALRPGGTLLATVALPPAAGKGHAAILARLDAHFQRTTLQFAHADARGQQWTVTDEPPPAGAGGVLLYGGVRTS